MNRKGIPLFACCLGIALGLAALAAHAQPAPPEAADADGFRSLFNGKTLAGWDGDPRFWSVENGCIIGQTTAEKQPARNTFLIWRGGKPSDFEIKIEFRMPNPGFANSGVQIRSWEGPEPWRVSGYQPDMDGSDHYTGTIYGENYRGGLAGRGEKVLIGKDGKKKIERFADAAELGKFIKHHDWNEYDIVAQGNRISEKVNGHLMCELVDEDAKARADGVIALQIHKGDAMKVEFRNVRFKELKHDNPMKAEAKKKIVFLAGSPSHGYAQHEHNAGCLLLAKCINENVPEAEAIVIKGWPQDPHVLDDAATVVIYCDGGGGHLLMKHLDEFDQLAKKGVGLVCLHYAVEIPKGKPGDLLKSWIGGYFETFWSVNPDWNAHYEKFPDHPVARGLLPCEVTDEWYFHMRFADEMKGVTPIFTAIPPDAVHRKGNDSTAPTPKSLPAKACRNTWPGPSSGPTAAADSASRAATIIGTGAATRSARRCSTGSSGQPGWKCRPIGVPSKTPTFEELKQNLDPKSTKGFDAEAVKKKLEAFKK